MVYKSFSINWLEKRKRGRERRRWEAEDTTGGEGWRKEEGKRREKKKLLQALITSSLGILPEIEEYFIMFIGSVLKKEEL